MRKKLAIAAASLVVLLVAGVLVASHYLGAIVTAGVNRYGPQLTGTKVTLASATVLPFNGDGTLHNFVVGNPPGWSGADLVSLGRIHVAIEPRSLLADHVVIDDIDVDQPEFDYETRFVASNVGDLLDRVEHVAESGGLDIKSKKGKPMRFEVRHLRIHDGAVRLGAGSAGLRIPLPPVELANLGSGEGGITASEFTATVMRALTSDIVHASTQAAREAGATAGAAAAQGVRAARDRLKGLFGGKKK